SLDEGEIVYSISDYLRGDLSGLNYDADEVSMGVNLSSLSYELHISGDVKIHDSSLETLNSKAITNGTDLLVQNGYVIIFEEGDNIFSVYDEYSISSLTLKFSVSQPSEKRIVRGSAIRGNFLITISDADPS